jgi:xanthine dehydrogenase accessory factor
VDWLGAVGGLRHERLPGVLVTVIEVRGHAPRDPGAKMVVGTDQTWGSVGGGNLEETAIARSRELIATGAIAPELQRSRLNEHAHNEHGRQCCGGEVTLLLEPLPARPVVAIFGIGHVGYELARILCRHEIQLHLVDSRAEVLDPIRLSEVNAGSADVAVNHAVLGESVLERLPPGAHIVIMTHDHAEDFALCDMALRRPSLASIGLIGSAAKWMRFQAWLAAQGHDRATIDRITCPIGQARLGGKEPATIALGVAADIVTAIGSAHLTCQESTPS